MSSVLITLPNHVFTVGQFTSGSLPVPAGSGLRFDFTWTGSIPAGDVNGKLMDIRADLSINGGSTWPTFAAAGLGGGPILDRAGNNTLTVNFTWDWGGQTPTHIKFFLDVFVANTATVVVTNL